MFLTTEYTRAQLAANTGRPQSSAQGAAALLPSQVVAGALAGSSPLSGVQAGSPSVVGTAANPTAIYSQTRTSRASRVRTKGAVSV